MKVIIIGPDPSMLYRNGGVAKFIEYQKALQGSSEIEIDFIYLDWKNGQRLKLPNFICKYIGILIAALKLFLVRKCDGVHLHGSLYNKGATKNLMFAKICEFRKIPFLLQIHGGRLSKLDDNSKNSWLQVFKTAYKIGVFAGPQYQELEQCLEEKKLIRLINFIPDINYREVEDYEKTNFLFLGRVVKEKGIYTLIESFLTLKEERSASTLTIIGNGDCLEDIKQIVTQSKYEKDIIITGFLRGERLNAEIDKTNVFVLPSWHEGFPLSFLECAARGMAPLITTNNAIPFYFEEDKEYLPIDLSRKDHLLNQMKSIDSEIKLKRNIGERVQKKVLDKFSQNAYMDSLIQLYHSTF